MGALLIVDAQPTDPSAHVVRRSTRKMCVQDFGAIAAVEALDMHALILLAWLEVVRRHAMLGAPLDEGLWFS